MRCRKSHYLSSALRLVADRYLADSWYKTFCHRQDSIHESSAPLAAVLATSLSGHQTSTRTVCTYHQWHIFGEGASGPLPPHPECGWNFFPSRNKKILPLHLIRPPQNLINQLFPPPIICPSYAPAYNYTNSDCTHKAVT